MDPKALEMRYAPDMIVVICSGNVVLDWKGAYNRANSPRHTVKFKPESNSDR